MLPFSLQVRFVTKGSYITTILSINQLWFRSRNTESGRFGGEQTLERSPQDQRTACFWPIAALSQLVRTIS